MNVTPATVFDRKRPEQCAPVCDVLPPDNTHENALGHESNWAEQYELGNPELPIAGFRREILRAVEGSQATIITAETGAGKSTQLPQMLVEEGYEVIVTQPRVVAARSVAERVREEIVGKKGEGYRDFVGYRTAHEHGDNPDNQILFVTDGLQLVRGLSERPKTGPEGQKRALVLDEVHEWNENMEVLVAWARQRIQKDPDFKVVVMSATMESDALANYFSGATEQEAPVVEVPGRTFPVEKHQGGNVTDITARLAAAGKNTLVFVPGKAEITDVIADLQKRNIGDATVLPLHGQLTAEEQKKVFQSYDGAKVVVATNVAQTSITIEDIHAVVDSGLERQNQVRDGVDGLYLNPISRADCEQRAGRAGRTQPGEYYLAQLGGGELLPLERRPAYPTPEILRSRLDGTVLRLAKNGFDAAEMDFYNVVSRGPDVERQFKHDVQAAKQRLQKLGALHEDGSITKIGRRMDRMPVDSRYARMMIEAEKHSPEVRMQLSALLAIQEAGGICVYGSKNRPCDEKWRQLIQPGVHDSDMISQLEVFINSQGMSDRELRQYDIHSKGRNNAKRIFKKLRKTAGVSNGELILPTDEQRQQLVKCIIAGMVDNLYRFDPYYGAFDAGQRVRELSSRSMVGRTIRQENELFVGVPYNLQIQTKRGGSKTLHFIQDITKIPSADVLQEVAPHLMKLTGSSYTEVGDDGKVYKCHVREFNGMIVDPELEDVPAGPERRKIYAKKVVEKYRLTVIGDIDQALESLSAKSGRQLRLDDATVADYLASLLPDDIQSLKEAAQTDLGISVEDIFPAEEIEKINQQSPDEYCGLSLAYVGGKAHVEEWYTDEQIFELPPEALRLPDGRPIFKDYRCCFTLEGERRRVVEQKKRREITEKAQGLIEKLSEIEVPENSAELADTKQKLLSRLEVLSAPHRGLAEDDAAVDEVASLIRTFGQDIKKAAAMDPLAQKLAMLQERYNG